MALIPTTSLPKDPLAEVNNKYYDVAQTATIKDLYKYAGDKIGYVSRYENVLPSSDNEDFYANEQSGFEKTKNAIAQLGVLAGATYQNHFFGYGRDISAAMSGDWNKLWNDELGHDSARKMGAVADLFPIYETKEQRDRRDNSTGLWGAAKQYIPFTGRAGNAWANMGGQLGFTIGTVGAIVTEEVALSALTAGTEGAAAPILVAKTALNVEKLGVLRSMYKAILEGKNLYNMAKVAEDANMLTKVLRSKPINLYRQVAAAKGEAAIEANFAAIEHRDTQIEKYIAKHGKYPPQSELDEIEENVIGMGNSVFNTNVAILTASNYLAYRNLFKPANLSTSRFVEDFAKKDIIKGLAAKNLTKKSVMDNLLKNSPKLAKGFETAGKGLKVFGIENISEGLEEVSQGFASGAAKRQFDMFDSDYGKGMGAFFLAASDEIAENAGSKEMWDEFMAGFMTGFGIQGAKAIKSKITGENKRKQAVVADAVSKITNAHSSYVNALNQSVIAEQTEDATKQNKIREAKDLKNEAQTQLFIYLEKNGVAKEYLEQLGDSFSEMVGGEQEANVVLQDRNVNEIVSKTKAEYDTFEKDLNAQRKRVGNPNKEGTAAYEAWDAAIGISVGIHTASQDMLARAKKLYAEVETKLGIDKMFLEGVVDPTTITENKRLLEQDLEMAKSRLTLENISEIEKQKTSEDIKKIEQRLEVITALNDKYFEADGSFKSVLGTEQSVSDILRGMMNSAANPTEAKQLLEDMEILEREGSQYLQLYNLLSDKEAFAKFGKTYVDTWMAGVKTIQDRITNPVIEQKDINKEEQFTQENLENEVDKNSTGEAQSARQIIEDLVESGDIVKTAGGGFRFKGKEFENVNTLFNEIKKEGKIAEETLGHNLGEMTLEEALKRRINGIEQEQADPAKNTQEEVKKIKNKNVTKKEPKTKKEDEKEVFSWTQKSGQTLTHYFDIVMGAIWKSSKYTIEKLTLSGKDKILKQIIEATSLIGDNHTLSNIYLANQEQLEGFLDGTVKEFNERHTDVQVVYDGIRLYIITEGNVKTAQQTIQDLFGINIPTSGQIVSLENEKGETIESGFRGAIGFNAFTDEAVFGMEKGDNVNLVVLDNEFNRNLLTSEKSEEEKIDQLTIGVYNIKDELVGVLRAGDFLYEAHPDKIKEYRNKLASGVLKAGTNPIGVTIGSTNVGGISVARNYNVVDGVKQYVPVGKYSPNGYEKEFLYVTDEGVILNEKGEEVEPNLDRSNLAFNAVYMRLKNGAKEMTVQVVREGENSRFTKEEFDNGTHLTEGLTGLKENTPIISRRIVVNMDSFTEEEAETKDDVQEIKDKEEDIVNEVPLTNEEREKIEEKYGVKIGIDPISRRAKVTETEHLSEEDSKKLIQEFRDATHPNKKEIQEKISLIERYTKTIKDIRESIKTKVGNRDVVVDEFAKENNDGLLEVKEVPFNGGTALVYATKKGDKWSGKGSSFRKTWDVLKFNQSFPTEDNPAHVRIIMTSEQKANYNPKDKKGFSQELRDLAKTNRDWENVTLIDIRPNRSNSAAEQQEEERKLQKIGELIGKIDALKIEISELERRKTITVTDTKGGKATMENAVIDGDNLTNGEQTIPLSEIEDVSEPIEEAPKTVEEQNQEEWRAFLAEDNEKDVPKWMAENGIVGQTYTYGENSVTIIDKNENGTFVEEDGIYYGIDENNELQTLSPVNGQFVMNGEANGVDAKKLKVVYKIGNTNEFITSLALNISRFGIDGHVLLTKLFNAYKSSYESGNAIQDIEELIEAAKLTLEEQEILAATMTPIFQAYLWKTMLNVESVWDMSSTKRWEEFSISLNDSADFLSNVFTDGVPLSEYRQALKEEEKNINNLGKKFGIKIKNLNFSYFSSERIREFGKELKEALSIENFRERWTAFVDVLAKLGFSLEYSGTEMLRKIDEKSIARNPFFSSETGIMTDVSMISYNGKNYIRNEADGTFVEKPYTKEKASEEILKIQKLFVSLLGIKLPIGFLQNYLEINGTLDNFREKAIQYKRRLTLGNNNLEYIVLNDAVKTPMSHGKTIVSETDTPLAEFEGKQYVPIFNTTAGKTIYLEEGQTLNPTQIRNIMREENILKNTRSRMLSFGNRTKNMKRIQTEIENLTCKI